MRRYKYHDHIDKVWNKYEDVYRSYKIFVVHIHLWNYLSNQLSITESTFITYYRKINFYAMKHRILMEQKEMTEDIRKRKYKFERLKFNEWMKVNKRKCSRYQFF